MRKYRYRDEGEATIGAVARLVLHLRTPLYRNGYALILNSVMTSVLGVGYWVLATRSYATATVGLNSAAISTMLFLAGVGQLNLGGALIRFLPGAGRATGRFVISSYLISIGATALVSLVFLRGLDLWAPSLHTFGTDPLLMGWFMVATVVTSLLVLQDNVLTGMRQATWVPIKNTIFSLAKILLVIGFARAIPQDGIFASWTLGMLVTLIPVNLLIFRRLIPKHAAQLHSQAAPLIVGQIVSYVAADYLALLFGLASTMLMPIIVTQQAGAVATAYFFLAWQIASMLFLVSGNMGASLVVEAVNVPSLLDVYTRRVFTQTLRILLPLVAFLGLGAPYVLRVFGTEYATNATWLLRLLALAAIPLSITSLYVNVAVVWRHMRAVVLVQATSCVLVLTMSYCLLQVCGIVGIGVAWLVSQSLIAVVVMFMPELRALRPAGRHLPSTPQLHERGA